MCRRTRRERAGREDAATLYRAARTRGLTLRSSIGCLIATVALRTDNAILDVDRDFEVLAQVSDLDSSLRSIDAWTGRISRGVRWAVSAVHRSPRCHVAWNSTESTTGAAASTARSKVDSDAMIAMAMVRMDDPSGMSNR